MIRLFLLLLGAEVVRRRWRSLVIMGLAWCVLGIFIFIGSLDRVTLIPVHDFGWLLLVEGAVSLLAASAGSGAARGLRLFKGAAVATVGLLMVDSPFHSDVALALIIGIVFAADGTLKVVSARVVRFPRLAHDRGGRCGDAAAGHRHAAAAANLVRRHDRLQCRPAACAVRNEAPLPGSTPADCRPMHPCPRC